MGMSSLSQSQADFMKAFYSGEQVTVPFAKAERRLIDLNFKKTRQVDSSLDLDDKCPAFKAEMEKVLLSNKNIQGAVFSECVYVQALAQKLNLGLFVNLAKERINPAKERFGIDPFTFGIAISSVLKEHNLSPRYLFTNSGRSKVLIQAGGNNGVDCAYIDLVNGQYFTIELKEAYSKTPEPDLPKYSENGKMIVTEEFLDKYPQFASMLEDTFARDLNYFVHAGKNFNKFTQSSVESAANESYTGSKSADVVCTEDKDGILVMLPAHHIGNWADLEGEIRPAGRNRYALWTPKWFISYVTDLGGSVNGNQVSLPLGKVNSINQRGGMKASGYKIGSLFYVKGISCALSGNIIQFSLDNVMQLNPTIAVKMNFKKINYKQVKDFYFGDK